MTVIPTRPPGRIGPFRESHAPELHVHKFFAAEPLVANQYKDWDGTHGITLWGTDQSNALDGNDQYGDCGAAAVDHGNAAKANNVNLVGTLGQPKFPGTVPTYFAYGTAMGELGPDPDQGVDNATWLGFLWKNGIIAGYGEVQLDHLDVYAAEFNGLLIGLQLYGNAQSDFSNHLPWGSQNEQPDPSLGHDTWLIETKSDASGGLITWGYTQPFTPFFRRNNFTDAWAIYDANDPRVNWSELQQALEGLHGTQTPQAV